MLVSWEEPKIVVIGGGSGSSAALRGLKSYTGNLTAVVTMFDSGGSSGLLQREFGYPPLGDLRQCLLGLSDEDESNRSLRELLDFRFHPNTSLNGHSLGNLLLGALTTIGEDLEWACAELGRLLRIRGQVVPVSLERSELCAELETGEVIRGESEIDLRHQMLPRIKGVYLDPPVDANPKAVAAILDADVIVLGPGDLYTSIIPNLLVVGVPEALAETHATRVYICNLMTKLGETDGFQASDFVKEILNSLGGPYLDWVLINNHEVSKVIRYAYESEGALPVVDDLEVVRGMVPGVYAARLGNDMIPLKHDSSLVAAAVLKITKRGLDLKAYANGNGKDHILPSSR